MTTDIKIIADQQTPKRYLSLIDCAPYNLPITPGDEEAIAQRWAKTSLVDDLLTSIQGAREEARLCAIRARDLDAPHQSAERATVLRHMLNERLRCRIATKAIAMADRGRRLGNGEVTPDSLLSSIESLGWVTADARGAMMGRPTETVRKDFMTAAGPKAADITAIRAPTTGDIHFRCRYMSEGHNILLSLTPKIPMGSSLYAAHITLRELLVTIERQVSMSYAGKLLRTREFVPASARRQKPEAAANAGAPKRMMWL